VLVNPWEIYPSNNIGGFNEYRFINEKLTGRKMGMQRTILAFPSDRLLLQNKGHTVFLQDMRNYA